MWRPGDIPIDSSESKPQLIQTVQDEGFKLHSNHDVYGNDRRRVRIGFPKSIKRSHKFYSGFDSTPSMTVFEMVYSQESKRLGTGYFTEADLPVLDVWDDFEATLSHNGDIYESLSTYKENAKVGSGLNVHFEGDVRFSILRKDYRKMSERIDEFPVSRKGLLTIGLSILIVNNDDCFLGSTIQAAERILDKTKERIEEIKGPSWEYCLNLGSRLKAAEEKGELFVDDFDMFLSELRKRDEKTHDTIMEGYNG